MAPNKSPGDSFEESMSQASLDDSQSTSSFVAITTAQRDEVEEVRRLSKRETNVIRLWRVVLTLVLLGVAVAVTLISYRYLKADQAASYQTAFAQFSGEVFDSTMSHQLMVAKAIRDLAEAIEANANAVDATWPFYTVPYFETYAEHALLDSHTEIITIAHFVKDEQVEAWINYTGAHHETWVKEGHMLQKGNLKRLVNTSNYHPYITQKTPEGQIISENVTRDFYVADWSYSPPPSSYGAINFDFRSVVDYENIIQAVIALKNETVFTRVKPYSFSIGLAFTVAEHNAMHSQLPHSNASHPHYFAFHPVHKVLRDPESEIVAVLHNGIAVDASLRGLLPVGVSIVTVIKNDCNQTYTYELVGPDAFYLGEGDFHDPRFDNGKAVEFSTSDGLYTNPNYTTTPGHCQYTMHVYPSQDFHNKYNNNTPEAFAVILMLTFISVACVFLIYDIFVQKRNNKIIAAAAHSNAVVSSLFPGNIRDRVMATDTSGVFKVGGELKSAMTSGDVTSRSFSSVGSPPLADLFLDTTILFADIAGFTAWSSVREPHQVFTLLETVYGVFDVIAKRRGVFKVETVGDCYVAASGLPDPRKDHAVAMARFAKDIIQHMTRLTKDLVLTLGPDTGDLTLRIGMHSGPVTAGVLRGERARFQLFGDTMNTASRMESTGIAGKIQLSRATACLLIDAGKGFWLEKRQDTVIAKGKGELETFWLKAHCVRGSDHGTNSSESGTFETASPQEADYWTTNHDLRNDAPQKVGEPGPVGFTSHAARLIDWNTAVLERQLRAVVARRIPTTRSVAGFTESDCAPKSNDFLAEVVEIVHLPEFDPKAAKKQQNPETVQLTQQVTEQLRNYVASVASLYRDNPFHNFEHASHVMMSVNKLMSRILAPADIEVDMEDFIHESNREDNSRRSSGSKDLSRSQQTKLVASMHDHTYGITSDPLTLFACALSALVHDVDHTGVPNGQLIKENAAIAGLYNNRSVAEQNSLDLAWMLLMDDCYRDLRGAVFTTEAEFRRFRQLLVNAVMATDIADKDLKALRNARWDEAFKAVSSAAGDSSDCDNSVSTSVSQKESQHDAVNRKATIVIEHLIQASDVSHTMQHWHVYRKWNERLFEEMYQAYQSGRGDEDPAEFWFQGELNFFDFYIIPLAMKLKECGVFGKASDEYLTYAVQNRREWEARGQELVAQMVEKFKNVPKALNQMERHD